MASVPPQARQTWKFDCTADMIEGTEEGVAAKGRGLDVTDVAASICAACSCTTVRLMIREGPACVAQRRFKRKETIAKTTG